MHRLEGIILLLGRSSVNTMHLNYWLLSMLATGTRQIAPILPSILKVRVARPQASKYIYILLIPSAIFIAVHFGDRRQSTCQYLIGSIPKRSIKVASNQNIVLIS